MMELPRVLKGFLAAVGAAVLIIELARLAGIPPVGSSVVAGWFACRAYDLAWRVA